MTAIIEKRAQLGAERAAWPDRFAAVRDAIARGFWPNAYGPIGRPPTKFAYPAGGIELPRIGGSRKKAA